MIDLTFSSVVPSLGRVVKAVRQIPLFKTNYFYIVFISNLVYLILYGKIIHNIFPSIFFFYDVIL